MSSERQKTANAANAAKSTGPRTAEGLAVSSGNARKHNLTAPPVWDDVSRYYALIMGDSEAEPIPLEPISLAALALAEAEARVARCVTAERNHLMRMADLADKEIRAGTGSGIEISLTGKISFESKQSKKQKSRKPNDKPGSLQSGPAKGVVDPDEAATRHKTLRVIQRYRREAEAQRRKALRQWLETLQASKEVERTENAAI